MLRDDGVVMPYEEVAFSEGRQSGRFREITAEQAKYLARMPARPQPPRATVTLPPFGSANPAPVPPAFAAGQTPQFTPVPPAPTPTTYEPPPHFVPPAWPSETEQYMPHLDPDAEPAMAGPAMPAGAPPGDAGALGPAPNGPLSRSPQLAAAGVGSSASPGIADVTRSPLYAHVAALTKPQIVEYGARAYNLQLNANHTKERLVAEVVRAGHEHAGLGV